jgi:hypothetical protein
MNSPTPVSGTVARAASEPCAGDAGALAVASATTADQPLAVASAAAADLPPLTVASPATADQPDGEIGPAVKPNDTRPGVVGGAGP